MLLGVHHVAIATADMDRMIDFYTNVLGMTLRYTNEWSDYPEYDTVVGLKDSAARVCLLTFGNFAVEMFQYTNPPSVATDTVRPVNEPGITHFAFAVDDLNAEYDRMVKAGVTFHGPPPSPELGPEEMPTRAVYGRDPDGNVFELMEFVGETELEYEPAQPRWRKAG